MKQFRKDEQGNFICEECTVNGIERTFKTFALLAFHITKEHDKKAYHDKFLFEKGDNRCKNPKCNNETEFKNLTDGYRNCCCKECTDKYRYLKTSEGVTKKYGEGVTNVFQAKEVIEKRHKTIETNIANDPEYLNNVKEKCIKTLEDHYGPGITNAFQAKEVIEKLQNTMLEKHGVKHALQKEEFVKKAKQTSLEIHGDENFRNIEKSKETYFAKTGYYYSWQNPEIIKIIIEKNHITKGTPEFKQKMINKNLWLSDEEKTEYEIYRQKVLNITGRHLKLYGEKYLGEKYLKKLSENKNILEFRDKWSVDHKFSVKEGFRQNIDPLIIGSITNLNILTINENVSKYDNCSITLEQLLYDYHEFQIKENLIEQSIRLDNKNKSKPLF